MGAICRGYRRHRQGVLPCGVVWILTGRHRKHARKGGCVQSGERAWEWLPAVLCSRVCLELRRTGGDEPLNNLQAAIFSPNGSTTAFTRC